MSHWILWHSVIRMGYVEMCPMWKTKPDVYDTKEECKMAISTVIAQYVANLKNNRDVIEIKNVTDGQVTYIIEDHTHPSGKREVHANWRSYPAGFNPNEPH